ncbi:MAG: hypothetical protein U0T73_00940 [Chitinophagales bacterium]
MKKILTALLFAGVLSSASAQQNGKSGHAAHQGNQQKKLSVEDRAKRHTDNLSAIETLSKDQYDKIYGYNLDFQKQRETLGGKRDMTQEEQNKLKELRKALRENEDAVLTADQKKLLKEHHQKEHAERKPTQGEHNDD